MNRINQVRELKIRREKEKKQKEELMEFLCSLKQQTSLTTLDFPEGFAMGSMEEINQLKTDDSKNKSTLSKIMRHSKVTSLEKVQKARSQVDDQSALQHDSKIKPQSKVIGLEQVAKAIPDIPRGPRGLDPTVRSGSSVTGKGRGRGRPKNVPIPDKPKPPTYGGAGHLIQGEIARAYNRNPNGSGSSSSSSDNSFKTVVDRFERIQLQK